VLLRRKRRNTRTQLIEAVAEGLVHATPGGRQERGELRRFIEGERVDVFAEPMLCALGYPVDSWT
jgi:hypothetical protein